MSPQPRLVYFIADGTGTTLDILGPVLLSQFSQAQFQVVTRPFITTVAAAVSLREELNQLYAHGRLALVLSSMIPAELRKIVESCDAPTVDIFTSLLPALENQLQLTSSPLMGQARAISGQQGHGQRINAVNFALKNDDGASLHDYHRADLILLGVSRSGKTPACLYLALQHGIQVANYPLTEEDLSATHLPDCLQAFKHKLFGLSTEPERLSLIRQERKAHSRYASRQQCQWEVQQAEGLFRENAITFINACDLSVEELATRILAEAGIERLRL